jgi:hypothetical protein
MRNEKGQDIDVTAFFLEKFFVRGGCIDLDIAALCAGCTDQTIPFGAWRPDV